MLPHKAASCTASATQALDEPGCSKRKTPPKHSAREQSKIARDIEVLPAMTDGFITSPKGVRGVRQLVATFMAEKLLQTGASRATNSDFFALSNVQTANLGRCMAPGTAPQVQVQLGNPVAPMPKRLAAMRIPGKHLDELEALRKGTQAHFSQRARGRSGILV